MKQRLPAAAHAQTQGQAALIQPSELDPSLLALAAASSSNHPSTTSSTSSSAAAIAPIPIDPALFVIEQAVHQVRRGIRDEFRGHVPSSQIDQQQQQHYSSLPLHSLQQLQLPPQQQHQHQQQQQQQQHQHLHHNHHHSHPQHQHQHEPQMAQQHHVARDPTPPQLIPHNPEPDIHQHHVHHVHTDPDPNHIQLDEDGIDPALREIVNSLTNAQQSHHQPGDNDERERLDRERLQQTIQTTLDDFAQGSFGSYGAIFNTNFPQSPNNHNLLLGPLGAEAEAHAHSTPLVPPHHAHISGAGVSDDIDLARSKRGRGRPKGSKNKPKIGVPPPAPKPVPPPRPKGRPPKVRSAEELAEFERRKEEKALGIKRQRGRPRKYPELGLVREMRLKKNRESVQEKIRMLEERRRMGLIEGDEHDDGASGHVGPASLSSDDAALGEQVAAAVAQGAHENDHYHWSYQDGQSLLDAVGASVGVGVSVGVDGTVDVDVGAGVGMGMGENQSGGMDIDVGDAPSMGTMDQNDDGMRGVFSLADVAGVQQ